MKPGKVVNHIPVAASGSRRAAAGINDAAKTVVRCALGFKNGSTTGQPASGRRRWSHFADRAAQREVDGGELVVVIHGKVDATGVVADRGSGRQRAGVHAEVVSGGCRWQ